MNTTNKLLIANRGEIALRIQKTAQALGFKTTAIYTKEDQYSSYVHKADESYLLSGNGGSAYLNQEEIISIAKQANADAIHPGYGFLSENDQFAQLVKNSSILWIGPTPEQIALLGDKNKSQGLAKKLDIPTIPGKVFDATENLEAKSFANTIGFPILIKCAHGGGGKAMRLVMTKDAFEPTWNTVTSESKTFFKSSSIIIEKYIAKPRHVEIQIAGDGKNYIHLYERECSIQRRHQKIIEESPCLFISQQTKKKLYNAAITIAKAINYKNIGTVEFLVTPEEEFYFLEINPRLQVEHSVTEKITNIDLVWLQFYIAKRGVLPFLQKDISQHGHAIECRVCAEDPSKNFMPSTGIISNLVLANNPFSRIDHDLNEGIEITPLFDPMIAKLTTHSITRKLAAAHMLQSLSQTNIAPIKTNITFLQKIIQTEEFSKGSIHTQFLNNENLVNTLVKNNEKSFAFSEEEATQIKNLIKPKAKQAISSNKWKQQTWK